ncbi:hypothetical protein [Natronoglomus mannanivorans]|uniref:Uncharacterized protein n=1 Tax=Natronoglomus mannanivorans TaxID=2979990 RepID=A0AAP2YVE1_9EURY|nr:hypothetical protein [Halobacteria archaeon AArc-xg1-1]
MGSRHVLGVLLLAAFLLLAGCTAPVADSASAGLEEPTGEGVEGVETGADAADDDGDSGDDGDEPADESDADLAVEAETTAEADEVLPVDLNETFERTAGLVESEAEMPEVQVGDMDALLEGTYEGRQDPFQAALNMTETEVDTESARGVATIGHVAVDPNEAERADVEQVVVHEFFHAIQFAEGWQPQPELEADVATSTDYTNVELALVEGGAVWITDQYSAEYQDDDVQLQSERLAEEYETAPDGDRYFRAPYHYGVQYANATLEEPTEIAEFYENPPTTTEQLLHGLDPDAGDAQPATLSVETSADETWTLQRDDRLGELFVRVALETELDNDTAADAAAGWGNDRLIGFQHTDAGADGAGVEDGDGNGDGDGDDWGFVWVLHWDTADDADAFEDAFETTLAERTDERADETSVDRQSERTTVVTVGPDEFHEAVSVTGSEADLEVTVDGVANET